MTRPFDYPSEPLQRRHGPLGYSFVESFKPWLRDEFDFRCVYCLRRERWEPNRNTFEIDHVRSMTDHPELSTVYDNLVYACSNCNAAKRHQVIPDPGRTLLSNCVVVGENGLLYSSSSEALRVIDLLGLNDPGYVRFRKRWIEIIILAEKIDRELFVSLLSCPDDLPDLVGLRPPLGNSRPLGVQQSAFVRREAGVLPSIY